MRIKIINPNTSISMTKEIELCANKYASSGTDIITVNPKIGVDSIECYVDEYLAIPGLIKEILIGECDEYIDAYIIACFGDPGLQAARELTSKPVLGIAESAIAAAKMIAPNFSIISVLDRSIKVTEDVVKNYGAKDFCRSIRSTGLSVLEFGRNPQEGLSAIKKQCRLALDEDGAECLLLGCAGFVGFVEDMTKEFSVPVLDGVMPAVKFAEALVGMGLKTSKVNTWKYPEKKEYTGFDFPDINNLTKE